MTAWPDASAFPTSLYWKHLRDPWGSSISALVLRVPILEQGQAKASGEPRSSVNYEPRLGWIPALCPILHVWALTQVHATDPLLQSVTAEDQSFTGQLATTQDRPIRGRVIKSLPEDFDLEINPDSISVPAGIWCRTEDFPNNRLLEWTFPSPKGNECYQYHDLCPGG